MRESISSSIKQLRIQLGGHKQFLNWGVPILDWWKLECQVLEGLSLICEWKYKNTYPLPSYFSSLGMGSEVTFYL